MKARLEDAQRVWKTEDQKNPGQEGPTTILLNKKTEEG
jgi:hypothetical protein